MYVVLTWSHNGKLILTTEWLPIGCRAAMQRDGGYEKSINTNCRLLKTNCIMQPQVAAEWLPWLQATVVMRGLLWCGKLIE